jgi:hypothetical protein
LVNAAGTMPHAHAVYYWNRNLRGEILNFADPTFACAGAAAREFPYRSTWTAIARYTQLCKPLSVVTHVIPDDLFGSVSQFLKLRYNWPTPGGADADRLARRIADYHSKLMNTVIVPHSQGNMVTALALPLVAQYDPPGATGCVAELSLAAPIKIVDMNMPDSTLLRGMTIDGDILLRIGLPNDFTPYLTNANSTAMHLDTDWAVDPAIRTLALLKWGVKIHLVDENYLNGQLAAVTTSNLRQLYDRCMPE